MSAILCFFGLHRWRDDDQQTKRWHYQHCARCPKRRAVERESFSASRQRQ